MVSKLVLRIIQHPLIPPFNERGLSTNPLTQLVTLFGAQSPMVTSRSQSQRIRGIQRIITRERIRLPGLGHIGVHAQELVGRRVVVAVDY